MANQTTKKRGSKNGRFTMLPQYLLDSPAYQSLSTQARAVHTELARRYYGSNNGDISLSVRDAAARCKIAGGTARRCFNELEEKGFIKLRKQGSFDFKVRHAREWELTHLEFDGQTATKEFMKWRPAENSPVSI